MVRLSVTEFFFWLQLTDGNAATSATTTERVVSDGYRVFLPSFFFVDWLWPAGGRGGRSLRFLGNWRGFSKTQKKKEKEKERKKIGRKPQIMARRCRRLVFGMDSFSFLVISIVGRVSITQFCGQSSGKGNPLTFPQNSNVFFFGKDIFRRFSLTEIETSLDDVAEFFFDLFDWLTSLNGVGCWPIKAGDDSFDWLPSRRVVSVSPAAPLSAPTGFFFTESYRVSSLFCDFVPSFRGVIRVD